MVKDDYHKTRALCTDSEEINIAKEQSIYVFIYKIQEEVHRFTVDKVMKAKSASLTHSSLEKIDGIGPAKAKKLLYAFKTIAAIKTATEKELSAVKGISASDAKRIHDFFNIKH